MKTTLATVKSFIKREIKNDNFYIKIKSDFDGMTDCVQDINGDWKKADKTKLDLNNRNNLGFNGIWFVGSSRDYFENYEDNNFIGYSVSNCCGHYLIAMKRLY